MARIRVIAVKVSKGGIEIEPLDMNELQKEAIQEEEVMSTIEKISRVSGRKPTKCSCEECRNQCRTPCLGTPEDILNIIKAGYVQEIDVTLWMHGFVLDKCSPIPMVQAKKTKTGCIFHKNGLCELHDAGLKPTEGKLSHHTLELESFIFEKSVTFHVAREWMKIKNIPTIVEILKQLDINK